MAIGHPRWTKRSSNEHRPDHRLSGAAEKFTDESESIPMKAVIYGSGGDSSSRASDTWLSLVSAAKV